MRKSITSGWFSIHHLRGLTDYCIRRVLHDWPDAECVKILKNQADAMSDDSIILIAEMVVPKMVQREDCYVYCTRMLGYSQLSRDFC